MGCCNVGCLVKKPILGLEVSCWRFLEAEFLLEARVTLVFLDLLALCHSTVGPSAQTRDMGCLGEEEHASNLRKSDYLEKKKMVF
jgi:hypothetical protein